MATNNIRIVGYLPPPYHQKLREYMQAQSLTESAAIVKILQQFFDGSTQESENKAIVALQADIAALQRRMTILEQAVSSSHRFSKSAPSRRGRTPPSLSPLNSTELARRLGVTVSTLEEVSQQEATDFRDWSQRRDPAKRAWQKRGALFYPLSD